MGNALQVFGGLFIVALAGPLLKLGHAVGQKSVMADALKHNMAHYEASDNGQPVFTWGPKSEGTRNDN